MAPLDDAGASGPAPGRQKPASFSLETFVWRLPEGFAILDRDGVVQFANLTFLDMVQAGLESAVVGKNARVWFNRPGTGLRVILNLVEQHGVVRSLRTTLESELGMHAEVEISAVGDQIDRPRFFGLIVRDVMSHGGPRDDRLRAVGPEFADASRHRSRRPSGHRSRPSSGSVWSTRWPSARGNRTAAARSLGISRQSLYTKLKKYGLDRY